jgi:putative flippase GtrA
MNVPALSAETRRYLVIGVSVYGYEVAIILLLQWLRFSGVFAVSVSFWSGLFVSFLLQKIVTFRDHRRHHAIIIRQILVYSLLIVWNYCFTIAFTRIFENYIPPTVCRTIALGISTLWNFYLYKTKIFNVSETSEAKL